MIAGKKVLAVIPARGGSKGLPGKNVRIMCGKPLIAWSISQGLASQYIDKVLVTTDSQEIATVAEQHGASVPFLRPNLLAGDSASSIDVVLHATEYMKSIGEFYDFVVLLEPTSPLRSVSDISGALELLVYSEIAESVVGVVKVECSHPSFLYSIKNELLQPMLGSQPIGLRRQDLQGEYFCLEGSVYASSVESLSKKRSFYHAATAPWIVDRYKSIEIDELCDFIAVEALMKAKIEGVLK